jgi:hypothetical protein
MSGLGPLLAFFAKKDRFPNFEAIQLSPNTGWLLLVALIGAFLFVAAHKETWRRILLRMEDPRTLAVFRIVFALFTICNVNGLYEHWTYLFTDEGMWTTDVAQELRAKKQFVGFGDGVSDREDWGFFSFAAFLEWAKGPNYSLLMFNSSPSFFWGHIVVFELAMLAMLVGWQTKWTKWVAWFCFHSITMRNTIYWEGTENIYRCWFFYLCLSRCGTAYSVDNWLRCRKLRKAGKLSERDGPGAGAGVAPSAAHPEGLQAIYRLIPAWPRMLMIMQTAFLYLDTGVVKNGGVWHAGDANYYATSLDHFYRMPTTQLGAWFGTTLFRLNTWVVHYWEACFPLILIGLVVRFRWREGLPKLQGRKLILSRVGLLLLVLGFFGACIYAYPVHFKKPSKDSKLTAQLVQTYMMWGIPGVLIAYTLIVRWLQAKRSRLKFLLDWTFSRRFWLGLGTIFHVHLIFLTNIGWFTPGALATYICYFNGREIASIGVQIKRALGRLYKPWRDTPEPAPTEDATLPHFVRDGHVLGYAPIFTAAGIALAGVLWWTHSYPDVWESMGNFAQNKLRYQLPETLREQQPMVRFGWVAWSIAAFLITTTVRQRRGKSFDQFLGPVIVLGIVAIGYMRRMDLLSMFWCLPLTIGLTFLATRKDAEAPADLSPTREDGSPRAPWAYGPIGRLIAGGLFLYQILGIGIWLLPAKDSLSTWRVEAREPFKMWLLNTHTSQSWQMFAPNPPRSNLFMKVLVHDQDGEVFDLNTDVYACFDLEPDDPRAKEICDAVYPIPWIWYSRQRKMNRRIVGSEGGGGSWYQKWHARWICREWFMEHGELPDKIELVKVTYPIPKPEFVEKNGPYDPRTQYLKKHKEKVVHTTRCKTTPVGQVPNFIRERKGLETVPEKEIKTWKKNRCRRWEKHLKRKAEERGETVEDDDPRFKVCFEESKVPPEAPKSTRPKLTRGDEATKADERKKASQDERVEPIQAPKKAAPRP